MLKPGLGYFGGFAGVKLFPPGQKLIAAFLVGRVGAGSTHRTNLRALLLGETADAFAAAFGVYFVDGAALFDSLIRALRLAGPTADAVVADLVCHLPTPFQ
jgi:hypothetical protein